MARMNSRWKHSLTAAGLLAVAVLAWGCSMKLETGYQYRPLNASSAQRRAYYAPAFSPEKSAADQEKKGGSAPSFGSQH